MAVTKDTKDDTGYPGCYKCKHRSPVTMAKDTIKCRLNPVPIDVRDKYGHICSHYIEGEPEFISSKDMAAISARVRGDKS